jgi:uncharacterized cupredoxin-like copper-binding protein
MKRLFAILLLAATLIVVACGGGAETATGPQEVTLVATDIAFDQERIEVVAGQPVALNLRNEGVLEHDFSIMHIPAEMPADDHTGDDGHDMGHMEEQPELHTAAMSGANSSFTFTPTEPGEYTYFCSVPGHREAGMDGTLVVTAP